MTTTEIVKTSGGQTPRGTQTHPAPGSDLPTAIVISNTQTRDAVGNQLEGGHMEGEAQVGAAPLNQLPEGHRGPDTQLTAALGKPTYSPAYLRLLSNTVDEFEALRKATSNRLGQMTRKGLDKDGGKRGLGMDARSPEVQQAQELLEELKALEGRAVKALEKEVRKHPSYAWAKTAKGVGDKQVARLLAAVGHPYWNDLYDRPRTVSELWAYCGYAVWFGEAQKRRKGQKSNWSSDAKMRAWNIAGSVLKSGIRTTDPDLDESEIEGYPLENRHAISPLGELYLHRRRATADRVHSMECARCGPSGSPALPGSPWSGAHQQADALRVVAKEVLKQLWIAARDHYHDWQPLYVANILERSEMEEERSSK